MIAVAMQVDSPVVASTYYSQGNILEYMGWCSSWVYQMCFMHVWDIISIYF